MREVLGASPYIWQQNVLRAYAKGERRISIRSGHRVGKTALLSWITIHHLLCRFPQKTLVMAATEKQLFNALMPEIRSWISVMPEKVQGWLSVQSEYIRLKKNPSLSFLSAVAVRAENPEAIAGAHSGGAEGPGWILIIVDEASGPPDKVFESLAGSMAGPHACTILAGNPVRRTGFFYQTHTRLARRAEMKDDTAAWLTYHVSSKDNPNVSPDLAADIAKRYGENSNAYRVRVLGEFPVAEDDSIIGYDVVLAATSRDKVSQVVAPYVWGLKCGTIGDDRTCLMIRRMNTVPSEPYYWYRLDEPSIVAHVKQVWDATPEKQRPLAIYVDSLMWGSGVVHRLKAIGLPAVGVRISETPSVLNAQKYRNMRTENWFRMREWFERRDCKIPYDENLIEELSSQPYKVVERTSLVEAVEEKKVKELLGRAPSGGDALALTFCFNAGMTADQLSDWNKPLKRGITVV